MCLCACTPCEGSHAQVTSQGEGGGGRGEEGGEGGGCSPPTDSPNPLEAAKLHRRTLGLIYGFTQRDPPPPHDGPFAGWGSVGRGLRGGE